MTSFPLAVKRMFTLYADSPCVVVPTATLAVVGSPGVQTRQPGWSRSGESSGHRFGRPSEAASLFIRPRSSQPGNLPTRQGYCWVFPATGPTGPAGLNSRAPHAAAVVSLDIPCRGTGPAGLDGNPSVEQRERVA